MITNQFWLVLKLTILTVWSFTILDERVIGHSLWLLRKHRLEIGIQAWAWNKDVGWYEKLCISIIHTLKKLKRGRLIGAIGLGNNETKWFGLLAKTGRFAGKWKLPRVIYLLNKHFLIMFHSNPRVILMPSWLGWLIVHFQYLRAPPGRFRDDN